MIITFNNKNKNQKRNRKKTKMRNKTDKSFCSFENVEPH